MKNLDLMILLIAGTLTGFALSWWERSGETVAAVMPCLQAAIG